MTTRIFGRAIVSASIVAILALLSPSEVWAHRCGPQTLKVNKGSTISYVIKGHGGGGYTADYDVVDVSNPDVATIEPPPDWEGDDGVFKITGVKNGNTTFKINWLGQSRQGTCQVKVTVHE